MNKEIINVIWVDDDIDSLFSSTSNSPSVKHTLKEFDKRNIKVHRAHNFEEYRRILSESNDIIDAVITDINFSSSGISSNIEAHDSSGFEDLKYDTSKDSTFGREILYYIYSGRLDLKGNTKFIPENRIFEKDKPIGDLLDEMVREVNHLQTPGYRVRKKYEKELKAASAINENERFLFKELVKIENGDYINNYSFPFNGARKIVERIFTECKNKRVLPTANLNEVKHLLKNDKNRKYFMIKSGCEIMPKALIHSLEFFIDITQDGSHSNDELKLGVDSYVRKVRNINLYRSIISIAMDMCLWYKEVYNNIDSYLDKWEIDKHTIEDYGIVSEMKTERGDILLRCNNYQLHNDCKCVPGQSIGIKRSTENKRKRQILASEGIVMIDRYVYPEDIVIID